MYGYIYKTTDLKTNSVYIGQHTNHYVRKYQKIDPNYYGSGKIIQNIIKKHGTSSLTCEILEWCADREELNRREIFYIKQYKNEHGESCYNIAEGGKNRFNCLYLTAAQKKRIKEKELQTKASKSPEAKLALANRIRNTLLNKSPEEKARLSKQHSETWFKKPQEERDLRESHRAATRANWTADQREANSDACRKAKEKAVIITNEIDILEFPSALACSKALGWSECMAGMYIRKYNGVIKKKNSIYYNWRIFYKQ